MKMMTTSLIAFATTCAVAAAAAVGQTAKPKPKPGPKALPVVFAVLHDGKVVEPIGYIDKGKLAPAVDGASEPAKLVAFSRQYYKPVAAYRLIFGGADAGTVTIKSSDPKAECIANTAQITLA